jgi:methylenetetrahydrofolate dehydrogenase (NADP+)/methenyltetrahydrofolate cyclohydrolase
MTDTATTTPAAKVIDGRAVADGVLRAVAKGTEEMKAKHGIVPGLAVVLVGDDPASQIYVTGKGKRAQEVGFYSEQHTLPASTSEAELLDLVRRLNAKPEVHGILVQFPVPDHIDKGRVIDTISPAKDVDGLHPLNAGHLASGFGGGLVPCTPAGSLILIKSVLGDNLAGKTAVVIGRSNLVGRPMAQLLLNESCTVTIAHSRTRDLGATVAGADIVVAAVGKAEMVKGEWIKPGAVVIDVGMNRLDAPEKGPGKTKLLGDVAYGEAAKRAAAITPVPGGVGPMTIARLMANTLRAAELSLKR